MSRRRIFLFLACAAVAAMAASTTLQASELFGKALSFESGGNLGYGIAVADLNGDGKLDVVVASLCTLQENCDYNEGEPGVVGVLLGNGDGTFQPVQTYSTVDGNSMSVAIADLNGDGKPDLVVSNTCAVIYSCTEGGSISVLLGNGDGTFQAAKTYLSGGWYAWWVAVADLNGDGIPDVLVSNVCLEYGDPHCDGVVGVLLGKGNGELGEATTYETGGSDVFYVTVADVNRDGKLDMLVANGCGDQNCAGTVGVLLGNGDGTFQPPATYNSGGYQANSLAVGDVNGDGVLDVVAANFNLIYNDLNGGGVGVLLGNGDGTFQPATGYASGGDFSVSVALQDLNGDGKPDIAITNGCGHAKNGSNCKITVVGVLAGNGDGTFDTAKIYRTGGGNLKTLAVADVNGDGRPDLLLSNLQGPKDSVEGVLGVLLNIGPYQTSTSLASSPNPSGQGQAVTMTATVKSIGPAAPTGTVLFKNGSAKIGSATISGGVGTLVRKNLPVGTLPITAIYTGDSNSATSTSPVVLQVVHPAGK